MLHDAIKTSADSVLKILERQQVHNANKFFLHNFPIYDILPAIAEA